MKNSTINLILLFSISISLHGQCDFKSKLKCDIDIQNCCDFLNSSKINSNSSDSTDLKLAYYRMLCKNLNSDEIKVGFELYNRIQRNIISEKKKYIYYKMNSAQIRKCDKTILELGYTESLNEFNENNASYFSGELSKRYYGRNQREQRLALEKLAKSHFERYANNNYLKLIKYHSDFLLQDTSESLTPIELLSYEHLIKIINENSSQPSFKFLLDQAINNSNITEKQDIYIFESVLGVDLNHVNLKLQLEEIELQFFDYEVSKMYHKDTIVEYKQEVYYHGEHYSPPVIETTLDTIVNKISDQNEMSKYRTRFKSTYLYNIVNELENR